MDGSPITAIVPQPRFVPVREASQDDRLPRRRSKGQGEDEAQLDEGQLDEEEYVDGYEPPCSVRLYTKVDRMIATLSRAGELQGPFM